MNTIQNWLNKVALQLGPVGMKPAPIDKAPMTPLQTAKPQSAAPKANPFAAAAKNFKATDQFKSLNDAVAARNKATKGSNDWNIAQNAINQAYGKGPQRSTVTSGPITTVTPKSPAPSFSSMPASSTAVNKPSAGIFPNANAGQSAPATKTNVGPLGGAFQFSRDVAPIGKGPVPAGLKPKPTPQFVNKVSAYVNKVASEVSPKYTGKAYQSTRGKEVLKSFPGLPGNTTVTSDTSFVNSKPVGVLNTAKTPMGTEYVNTQNLQTGKSNMQMVPKNTMPGENSYFDGKNVRTAPLQSKKMK